MIITIGGLSYTKTSIISELLTYKYNFKKIETEHFFNYIIKKNNIIPQNFNNEILNVIKNEKNIILEGKLIGWYLHKNGIKPDLSIWLKAPFETRARRYSEIKNIDIHKSANNIINQEYLEWEKYLDEFNVDLKDLSIYDLIIDDEKFDINEIINLIDCSLKDILLKKYL